jgi:uncharacterized RDD family membrane protein YckC
LGTILGGSIKGSSERRQMTLIDDFVARVLVHIPQSSPLRDRIANDLRAHLGDSVAAGVPISEAILRMGTPEIIAEELTQGYTPKFAPYGRRLGAFFIDLIVFLPLSAMARCDIPFHCSLVRPERLILLFVGLLALVCVIPEWLTGQTLGKAFFSLRVERFDGTSINLGQAIIRHASWYFLLGPMLADGIFILGTQNRQRLADLLTKTVVVSSENPSPRWKSSLGWVFALIVIGALSWNLYPFATQALSHLYF